MKTASNWIETWQRVMKGRISQSFLLILLITLALFVLINIPFYLFNKQKSHTFHDPAVLANIYGQDKASDYAIVLREQGAGSVYEPFVEFVEKPRTGQFVNA
jgi:hypothetical protein